MGWFSKKKKNLPENINEEEMVTNVPSNIEEPLVVEESYQGESFLSDRMSQEDFERNYAMTKLNAGIAAAQEGLQTVNKVVDVWKYSKMVEQNIAQIQNSTTIELAKISAKFQLQQTALMGIFGQRQQGLNAHFTSLERALENNDREQIIQTLKGISSIVTSSPLEDFEKLAKAWDDTSKPLELDF